MSHPTAEQPTWREAFRLAFVVFLPVRVFVSLCGAGVQLGRWGTPEDTSIGGWLYWLLFQPWYQWDTYHYLDIARDGYGIADGRVVFHPLLPLLTNVVGQVLGGAYLPASLLVSNTACIVLLAALYKVVALDHGKELAGEATRWILYNPIGLVLLLPYTEPLVLAFILLSLWALRQNWWLQAGLWGCLATLTKQTAVALIIPMLWWFFAANWRNLLRPYTLYVFGSIALVPLGYLGYAFYRSMVFQEIVLTDPIAFVRSIIVSEQLTDRWGTRFGMPWEMLYNLVVGIAGINPSLYYHYYIYLLPTLVAIGLLIASLRHERAVTNSYSMIQLLLITMIVLDPRIVLISLPRRFLLIFPIFTQLARGTLKARWRTGYFLTSLILLGLQVVMFTGRIAPP